MAEKKEYRIKVQGQPVPVTEDIYFTYHRMKRRETYLEEKIWQTACLITVPWIQEEPMARM